MSDPDDDDGTPLARRPVEIPANSLATWADRSERIGEWGVGLRWELEPVQRDPTRHNLVRLAKTATLTANVAVGDEHDIARAIVAEVEGFLAVLDRRG